MRVSAFRVTNEQQIIRFVLIFARGFMSLNFFNYFFAFVFSVSNLYLPKPLQISAKSPAPY